MNVTSMTPFTKLKQSTDRDSRNFGPLVSGYEMQTSTLNQTQITLTQFVCPLDRKSSVMVYVDGQLLTEGVGNDYVWVTGQNGNATVLTLSSSIPAGLNIQIYKIGVSTPTVPNAETIQATSNFALAQVDQKNANRIINGGFDAWQRGTSFATIANGSYCADRFSYFKSGAMVHTISRSSDVPSGSNSVYSMLVDCTTADISIAAGDYNFLAQKIEGSVLRSFKGKSMVLSFWVKSPKIGTHCISIENAVQDRSLVREYTVNAANTWERKTIRFQHDPTGSWNYSNGHGMWVMWVLAAGSTYQTANTGWQSGVWLATANQVNVTDSISNDFYLSDVVLVEDNAALNKVPDFCYSGPTLIEDFRNCQRYYEFGDRTSAPSNTGSGGGQYVSANVYFKQMKRITPAVAVYDFVGTANRYSLLTTGGLVNSANGLTPQSINVTLDGFYPYMIANNLTFPVYFWIADAEI